ncbi:MAG: glycosyltransferase family 2 protein [Acidobacteriia bacterium]|jgi:glycosyltransferase involved in cell wall biosynthesis|nr:glycosyltransferase family 2 protein [Terriglobia bacterium]
MANRVALILPALDEEESLAPLLAELARYPLAQVIVADNGSRDRTAEVARRQGACVVQEPRRGYGAACLAGIAALRPEVDVVVFMDADGSDDPADLPRLLEPIERGQADLVIGSRVLGQREAGALTPQQRIGNALATVLLRLLFGIRATDLGPFRAIRRSALERLALRDPDFGWTVEMQIRAHRTGLRVVEIPVRYRRRRAGRSKISGTVSGTVRAGLKIIGTILKYRLQPLH